MNRKLSALAIATTLAAGSEGLRHYAYYDPANILTVCYGDTTNIVKGKYYSTEVCKGRLDSKMMAAINQVDRCVPGLPVRPLAAFADAVYNMGPTIACDQKNSTAARLLAAGKIPDACNQLPRWDKAKVLGVFIPLPGLVTRREAEKQLCLAG